MNLVLFCLAASVLFAVVAIPMPPSGNPNAPSAPLDPNHVPKIGIGQKSMTRNSRTATRAMMIDHYMALQPENEQKQARLAFAKYGWHDGNGPDDEHRQYLNFNYHRGDTPDSEKIGQFVTIARDRPLPESHFASAVLHENKAEMAKEMKKKYKALPLDRAKHVRSMKAHMDWVDGPGLREQTQMTFHRNAVPLPRNRLWDPVTVYRPMSFLIDDNVPSEEIPVIKKRIRQEHEKMDENDPLKQANFGVVTEGWHRETRRKGQRVGATLYKVKDQLTDSAEEDFEKIGDFHVPLGHGQKPEAAGSSSRETKS